MDGEWIETICYWRQTDRQTDSLVSSYPHFTMHTSMLPHLRASDGHHLRSKSITCKDSHSQQSQSIAVQRSLQMVKYLSTTSCHQVIWVAAIPYMQLFVKHEKLVWSKPKAGSMWCLMAQGRMNVALPAELQTIKEVSIQHHIINLIRWLAKSLYRRRSLPKFWRTHTNKVTVTIMLCLVALFPVFTGSCSVCCRVTEGTI